MDYIENPCPQSNLCTYCNYCGTVPCTVLYCLSSCWYLVLATRNWQMWLHERLTSGRAVACGGVGAVGGRVGAGARVAQTFGCQYHILETAMYIHSRFPVYLLPRRVTPDAPRPRRPGSGVHLQLHVGCAGVKKVEKLKRKKNWQNCKIEKWLNWKNGQSWKRWKKIDKIN